MLVPVATSVVGHEVSRLCITVSKLRGLGESAVSPQWISLVPWLVMTLLICPFVQCSVLLYLVQVCSVVAS